METVGVLFVKLLAGS